MSSVSGDVFLFSHIQPATSLVFGVFCAPSMSRPYNALEETDSNFLHNQIKAFIENDCNKRASDFGFKGYTQHNGITQECWGLHLHKKAHTADYMRVHMLWHWQLNQQQSTIISNTLTITFVGSKRVSDFTLRHMSHDSPYTSAQIDCVTRIRKQAKADTKKHQLIMDEAMKHKQIQKQLIVAHSHSTSTTPNNTKSTVAITATSTGVHSAASTALPCPSPSPSPVSVFLSPSSVKSSSSDVLSPCSTTSMPASAASPSPLSSTCEPESTPYEPPQEELL